MTTNKWICKECNLPCRLETGSIVEMYACPYGLDNVNWQRVADRKDKQFTAAT